MKLLKTLTLSLGLVAIQAHSACRWITTYDSFGTPKNRQVCDNTWDSPSVQVQPLPTYRIPTPRPMQAQPIAPLGTSNCTNTYTSQGWKWLCR